MLVAGSAAAIATPVSAAIAAPAAAATTAEAPTGPPAEPAYGFLLRTAVTAAIVFVVGYAVFARHSGRFGEQI